MDNNLIKAIQSINPKAIYGIRTDKDGVSIIDWLDETVPIPQSELDAKKTELQAEYDANQYQRDRQYPPIKDQLDILYWDKVNGTDNWQDVIAKVKSDNPKPE